MFGSKSSRLEKRRKRIEKLIAMGRRRYVLRQVVIIWPLASIISLGLFWLIGDVDWDVAVITPCGILVGVGTSGVWSWNQLPEWHRKAQDPEA